MAGVYIGLILFVVGIFMTFVLNRNVEVPMSGLFSDMPFRVQLGIYSVVAGGLLISGSVLYVIVSDPTILLR